MPILKNTVILAFAILAGIGLFLVVSGNSIGPWILVPGVIGCLIAGLSNWTLTMSPEVWEMFRDYFNCRWY